MLRPRYCKSLTVVVDQSHFIVTHQPAIQDELQVHSSCAVDLADWRGAAIGSGKGCIHPETRVSTNLHFSRKGRAYFMTYNQTKAPSARWRSIHRVSPLIIPLTSVSILLFGLLILPPVLPNCVSSRQSRIGFPPGSLFEFLSKDHVDALYEV